MHQLNANEHDGRARDEGWEDLLENSGRGEGHADFQESAACCSAENRAVTIWTGELLASWGRWAVSCCVHLAQGACCNRNCGETGTDDGDQTGADVVWSPPDVEAGDLNRGQDTTDDQGCGNEISLLIKSQIGGIGKNDWCWKKSQEMTSLHLISNTYG